MNEFFRIQEFTDNPKRIVHNVVPQVSFIGLRKEDGYTERRVKYLICLNEPQGKIKK